MTLAHEGYTGITHCSSCDKEFKFRDVGVEYHSRSNAFVFCEKCASEIARIIIQDLLKAKNEAWFRFFEKACKTIDFKHYVDLIEDLQPKGEVK